MFRTFSKNFLPNRLDWICHRAARKKRKRFLLGWNRGLGDIPLGLYAIVHRIREIIPDAEITFLIRKDLQDCFSLLNHIQTICAPDWVRGEPYDVEETLQKLSIDPAVFDEIIAFPSPTAWVAWQYSQLVPRLIWPSIHNSLCQKFDLPEGFTYIGVQVSAETDHGPWRNWPEHRWREFFLLLAADPKMRVILFGFGHQPAFRSNLIIDLRGKTSLFEMLSIIKNRCRHLVVPDSGILSMVYYLDTAFALQVLSLWADPKQGVLKQNVASPNPLLIHRPLIGVHRDVSNISAQTVLHLILESSLAK